MSNLIERIQENCTWRIRKFANAEAHGQNDPYEVSTFQGNLLLNEGINELWTILTSSGGTKYDNTHAYLGVGDSSTAADATQTGLQASTNKAFKVMDSGYPTYGTVQKAVFRSTFGTSEANFAWNEFTVVNASSDTGANLNRKVSSQGTKSSDQIWELELTITLS